MKRMTKHDYVNSINRKDNLANKLKRSLFVIVVISFVGSTFLPIFVRENTLKLPQPVVDYLLSTFFINFSLRNFQEISESTNVDMNLIPLILLIYWGHQVMYAIAILGIPIFTFFSSNFSITNTSIDKYLLKIHDLSENIQNHINNPNYFSRLRLQWKLNSMSFYNYISPITSEWHSTKKYQWLNNNSISKETRKILFTLSNFKESLNNDIKNNSDLSIYLPMLTFIESFLFLVINRSSKGRYEITDLNRNITEFGALLSFANLANPIIIKSLNSKRSIKREIKILIAFKQVFQSSVVKFAITISTIAAAVMMLGVLLFKLEASQAFLTWFTVTFGSLSISIGAASFREIGKIKKDDE